MRNALLTTLVAATAALPLAAQSVEGKGEFPNDWFWHQKDEQRARHEALLGKPMPTLELSHWQNGEASLLENLRGKVVVVDFWATWCGPCIRSIPHNNELFAAHADDGLVLIGVCGSARGQEKMGEIAESRSIAYPIARDANETSAKAWNVMWWPTYGVVDRAGNLRALGLKPEHVDAVVAKLLAEPAPEGASTAAETVAPAALPAEWRETGNAGREALDALEGKPAPALAVDGWVNSAALDLAALRGKVVLVDFWATWCGPCIRSIPHTNELMEQYADDLVVIGVCHPRGMEKMAATAEQHGIRYPIAQDTEGKTNAAYGVNGYPDYFLIDRQGRLRIADCKNAEVDAAVAALVAEGKEPAPAPEPKPTEEGKNRAGDDAKKDDAKK